MGKSELSFAGEAYLRAKALWRGERFTGKGRSQAHGKGASQPYSRGRDPQAIGDVVTRMTDAMGWTPVLEQAQLVSQWPSVVGADIAEHTEVLSIQGKILHVQCDSTAWATELRRMRSDIVTKIISTFPGAEVNDITFHGPHTPSWRHGYRRVQGRGPRDTYG